MANGSFIGAVRTFIENKLSALEDLVHPEVTKAVAAVSHEVVDLVEELDARLAACEIQLRGGEQIPSAPEPPPTKTE